MAAAASGGVRRYLRRRTLVGRGAFLLGAVLAVPGAAAAAPGAATAARPAPGRVVTTATSATALLESVAHRPGAITHLQLPPAQVGRPYFAVVRLPATAGNGSARDLRPEWRPVAGALPAGLRFDAATGAVLGLPQRAGDGWVTLERLDGLDPAGGPSVGLAFLALTVSSPAGPGAGSAERAPDAQGAHRGSITGTVTSAGHPLGRACVVAVDTDGREATTLTAASGAYDLSGLLPGKWEVLFEGCAHDDVAQWWPDQASQTTAHAVSVVSGGLRSSVSADLRPGGEITGRVSVAESGFGAPSVCAYAESADSINGLPTVAEGAAVTNVAGRYAISGLPTGSYELLFAPCTSRVNLEQAWWDDRTDPALADPVRVTAGAISVGISPALDEGAEISGAVSSASTGRPLGGMCAEAVSSADVNEGPEPFPYLDGSPAEIAETGPGGRYAITGLAAGNYLVEFYPCVGGHGGNYLSRLWHQASSLPATPTVSVGAGDDRTGIDAALAGGGSVTGTVTSKVSHRPLGGICVLVVGRNAEVGTEVVTSDDGRYVASGLATAEYEAAFGPCGDQNLQGAMWHGGAAFHVAEGATTAGISAELSVGGTIEGKVESLSGSPLTGLCLVISQSTGSFTFTEEVGPSGFGGLFSVTGLSPGRYSVGFDGSCVSENYESVLWKHGATVRVEAGAVVSHIRLELPRGGEIVGTVTDSTGRRLSAICLAVDGGLQGMVLLLSETYAFEGHYVLDALPTGAYELSVGPCYSTDDYEATTLPGRLLVRAGAVTRAPTVRLAAGGEISGAVTATGGGALTLICVVAIPAFTQNDTEALSFDGSYTLTGLGPGIYDVEFESCDGGTYSAQWWRDASAQAEATPVVVAAGMVTTGVNAVLRP